MFANGGMFRKLGEVSVSKREREVLSTRTYFWSTVFGIKVWQPGGAAVSLHLISSRLGCDLPLGLEPRTFLEGSAATTSCCAGSLFHIAAIGQLSRWPLHRWHHRMPHLVQLGPEYLPSIPPTGGRRKPQAEPAALGVATGLGERRRG